MKKLYFLDEQEKKRILNLHTEATKNQYLIGGKSLLVEAPPKTIFKEVYDNLIGTFRKRGVGMSHRFDDITDITSILNKKTSNRAFLSSVEDILEGLTGDRLDWMTDNGSYQGLRYIDNKSNERVWDVGQLKIIDDNIGVDDVIDDEKLEDISQMIPAFIKDDYGRTYPFRTNLISKIRDYNGAYKKTSKTTEKIRKLPDQSSELWNNTKKFFGPKLLWLGNISWKVAIGMTVLGTGWWIYKNYSNVLEGVKDVGYKINEFCGKLDPTGYTTNIVSKSVNIKNEVIQKNSNYWDSTDEEHMRKTLIAFSGKPYDFCSFVSSFKNEVGSFNNSLGLNAVKGFSESFCDFLYWEYYAESTIMQEPVDYFNTYVARPINDITVNMVNQTIEAVKEMKKEQSANPAKGTTILEPVGVDFCKTKPDSPECFYQTYPKFLKCVKTLAEKSKIQQVWFIQLYKDGPNTQPTVKIDNKDYYALLPDGTTIYYTDEDLVKGIREGDAKKVTCVGNDVKISD